MKPEAYEGYRVSPQQLHLWSEVGSEPDGLFAECAIRIHGTIEIERLRKALNNLVSSYEILRTELRTFGEFQIPVQVIFERYPVLFTERDHQFPETQ